MKGTALNAGLITLIGGSSYSLRFTITSVIGTAKTRSGRFHVLSHRKPPLTPVKPRKTRLMIPEAMNDYAHKRMVAILAAKIRRAP